MVIQNEIHIPLLRMIQPPLKLFSIYFYLNENIFQIQAHSDMTIQFMIKASEFYYAMKVLKLINI